MKRPEPTNIDEFIEKSTDAFMANIGGMSRADARQGVLQRADRNNKFKGVYWCAYDMAMHAATRDGAPSVNVVAAQQDALAKACEVINTECLR